MTRSALGILLALALWEAAGRGLAEAYVLAPPSAIALWLWQNAGLMARALGETLWNAALGYVIGNGAAVALAGLALAWARSEAMIRGLALLVFCLPLVATGPILRVVFGPGDGPQVALAALAVYYTTLIPLLVGLRAVPEAWLDLVRSYGRGPLQALIRVRARAALPYLVAGLQIAAPAAFLGAMVGEFTGAERGMGVLTLRAMRAMDVEMTWALATVATAIAMLGYLAVGALAARALSEAPSVMLAAPPARRGGGPWTVLLVAAAAMLIWAGGLRLLGLSSFFAKGPLDVAQALTTSSDAAANRAALGEALLETAVFLLPGYAAGLAAGAGLAMLIVLVPAASGAVIPVAVALRSVPIITTAPLVVLLLGRGALGTVTLVAIMVFFPTLIACLHGLRQAPGRILDVMESYAAGPLQQLIRVRIPAMLPAFFAAARMNVPASVLAVTVVEWLATGQGIGSVMALSASLSDYDLLWSAVAVTALLSVLGYGAVGLLERRVLRVYAPEQLA
ncbi:ABC transporter permease [Jannaschia seohaensis]|uniref:ABC-type nitrate/sulfonate/bicarbonate transport system permease component n=1 Tax=Jannaschia seohaensis TaxID=475081 RepID=A0A2Y9A4A4_9RHOB|nr:ABC transporter permease subunit [Jannaschia seohaensis]PWJ22438.1 ABC-type nitrate/sulfonate/bicarbonate transport system permease component [Jannaschia seohaensis]SSA38716.1 ABC-type nitrate/sulfonate/bicarbonate transport system, permease component [Jannaschia seohaensis]